MALDTDSGRLPRDSGNQIIQAPSTFQTEDATSGTTQKSPLTVADTEIDLVVPANAVALVLRPQLADLRVCETDGGTASAPYKVIPQDAIEKLPCAGMTTIHLLRDATTSVTLQFHFELLEA